jgi:hypothetical protein
VVGIRPLCRAALVETIINPPSGNVVAMPRRAVTMVEIPTTPWWQRALIALGKIVLLVALAAAILAGIEYGYSTEMVVVMVVIMLVATVYIMATA